MTRPLPAGPDPGRTCEALGVTFHALTIERLNDLISRAITARQRIVVGHHNLHSAYLFHRDPSMAAFYENADWIHADGMPLIAIARIRGCREVTRTHRITYADWIDPLMAAAAAHGWKVFYLGSKPGVADRGAQILRDRHRDLHIHTRHGYFDATTLGRENQSVLETINASDPDLLLVGMGMPRQERWVLENAAAIRARAILTSGACMDFVAGEFPTPPRWVGPLGFEWLHRLLHDPGRLAHRYLIEPWALAGLLVRDLIGPRRGHHPL